MSKEKRVAEMAKEILRKESYFNWQSLLLFVVLVGTLTLATLYILK